jgi:hypothetical protein
MSLVAVHGRVGINPAWTLSSPMLSRTRLLMPMPVFVQVEGASRTRHRIV